MTTRSDASGERSAPAPAGAEQIPIEDTPAPVDPHDTYTGGGVYRRALQTGGAKARAGRFFCPQRGLNSGATARLARETGSLLQRRLTALGWVLLLAWFLALARFYFVLPAGIPGSALGVASAAICIGLLRFWRFDKDGLRVIELVMFGTLLAALALNQYMVLGGALESGYLGLYRRMINRIPGLYTLAIVAHGMLVPNRWRRTATLAATAVAVAIGTGWAVEARYADMAQRIPTSEVLETGSFGLMMLGLALALAAYGAHLIHGYRRNLAKIDDAGMYLLERQLGSGGMGEIWQAQHRMLRRPVAIKMIRPDLLAEGRSIAPEVMQRRFRREARATAQLQSPNTVHIFDFGIAHDGVFFYVMEFLDGLDLAELVKRYGPMPADRAIYLIRQAALSLREAHERGLVHRDVKPGNIHVGQMAGSWDWVKVLDFGLVKLTEDSDEHTTELTGDTTTGTPAFFPPEMTAGPSAADHRADIYALGAVLYWLVTGQLVFPDLPPLQMMLAHAKEEPVPPSRRAEVDIPPGLEEVILWTLRKDPADRPQTMDELIVALDGIELEEYWSPPRAADWWRLHHPEHVDRAVPPGPETGPSIQHTGERVLPRS